MDTEGINYGGKTKKSIGNPTRANNPENRFGSSGVDEEYSWTTGDIKSSEPHTEEAISEGTRVKLRPKTIGGIVRQLILQAENQLAQKYSDIQFLESQLEQFRSMLSEWESGVSGIVSEDIDQEDTQ